MSPVVRPVGLRAALVEVGSAAEGAALAGWARRQGIAADEIVPAAGTVLFDGVDPSALAALLGRWRPDVDGSIGPLVEIPVRFDGPDLTAVAAHWGVGADEAVRRIVGTELVSAFCGFAPGFAYLAGLPPAWSVPRLASPRPRVEPGSVGLAGDWCGIYPSASPGGWQIVGHTSTVLWDVDADPPALLTPGTRVVLRAC